jgi:large subunit ribosomal protein L9
MQVILRNDVSGLGKRGDIVDVSDGHARNFLLPKGHAMKATAGAIEQAAKMRRSRDLKDASDREAATTIASTLVPKIISISAKAHDDKLFGSIHEAEIVAAVAEQTGIELDRKVITIDEAIRTLGQHRVTAALHADVSFPITIEVVAEG